MGHSWQKYCDCRAARVLGAQGSIHDCSYMYKAGSLLQPTYGMPIASPAFYLCKTRPMACARASWHCRTCARLWPSYSAIPRSHTGEPKARPYQRIRSRVQQLNVQFARVSCLGYLVSNAYGCDGVSRLAAYRNTNVRCYAHLLINASLVVWLARNKPGTARLRRGTNRGDVILIAGPYIIYVIGGSKPCSGLSLPSFTQAYS